MSDSSSLPPIGPLPVHQSVASNQLFSNPTSRHISCSSQASSTSTDDEWLSKSDGKQSEAVISTGDVLSVLQQEKMHLYTTLPDLELLCRENGLSALQFAQTSEVVTSLDLFLGFWTSMKSVMYFPALKELSIVKQPTICDLDGVNQCTNLESLCIIECGLTKIANLMNCSKLKCLNLSSNRIRKLENLDTLFSLETLWVNQNRLKTLDGVWHLTKLTTLWACRNQIDHIDASLKCCINLTELNLADNKLSNFNKLLSLVSLDQLSSLILSDVHFGDNPLCRLCNYQTCLINQLPQLKFLDTVEVSARSKYIAEATMIKKAMYYNMQIMAIKRDVHSRIRQVETIRKKAEHDMEASIWPLIRQKKEIECFLIESKNNLVSLEMITKLEKKLDCINFWLRDRYATMYRMNQDFDRLRTDLRSSSELNVARLKLELESGGNIQFEDGKPSDVWFGSCVELVRSRLFLPGLQKFGIRDIQIDRVTRIKNRFLRNRFQARIEEVLTASDSRSKENISKKGLTVSDNNLNEERDCDASTDEMCESSQEQCIASKDNCSGSTLETAMEYLFYALPARLNDRTLCKSGGLEDLLIAENGFSDLSGTDFGAAIKLSNSVALLDAPQITAAIFATSKQKRNDAESLIQKEVRLGADMNNTLENGALRELDPPSRVLLVAKVFRGHTKSLSNTEVLHAKTTSGTTYNRLMDCSGIQSLQVVHGGAAAAIAGENLAANQQKLIYSFDRALVLPEYFVEYQYVFQNDAAVSSNSSPIIESPCVGLGKKDDVYLGVITKQINTFEQKYRVQRTGSPQSSRHCLSLSTEESAELLLQGEPILAGLIESPSILMRLELAKTCHLRYLSLLGCELDAVPDLSFLANHLEVLILSYNKIQASNNLKNLPKLLTLDLSFNQIARFEHFETLCCLEILEVTHNLIRSFDEVERIRQTVGQFALKQLDLRNNEICGSKRYRLHVLQLLPKLTQLDQRAVLHTEIITARSLITHISLWTPPRPKARIITPSSTTPVQSSKYPLKTDENRNSISSMIKSDWNSVEEIDLSNQLLESIEGLTDAVNLRVVSFSDNMIKRIDGFQTCTRLESLNLDDNDITKVENFSQLTFLKSLSLGRNRVTSIPLINSLENLIHLFLEENQISSLRGLGSALKLVELYLANNRIGNLKEIQQLKSLPNLTILDLSGNKITCIPDYRLYSVFHLRQVKVLDSIIVSMTDQSNAKEKYSGKLTFELILEKCAGNGRGTPIGCKEFFLEQLLDVDVSSCQIRDIGQVSGNIFSNMIELNLDNNLITNISGLEALPKLRILKLNRNRIERLVSVDATCNSGRVGILACLKLEELQLAHNQITDMSLLGLQFLTSLKLLHLQSNAIEFLGGLECNTKLVELRLDKNRICQLDSHSTLALQQLECLYLKDNVLKSLSNFGNMLNLKTLMLSNNRLGEVEEVEKLVALPALVTLKLNNNPMTKKHLYRHHVIHKLELLKTLDGKDIYRDEKERTQIIFAYESAAIGAVLAAPEKVMESSTKYSTQLVLAPSSIPTNDSHSMSLPQSYGVANEKVTGSYLRKSSSLNVSQRQVPPAVPTISRPEHRGGFLIGPSNTNTRSLQVATYYSHHSHSSHGSQFSWQVGTVHAGGGTTFSSSLSATVASALSANLPGIRTRRHLSNIHYDQQHTSRQVHVKDGEMKRPVGKQAVAQNPGATIRKG